MDAVIPQISMPSDPDPLSPPDWRWQTACDVHERYQFHRRRKRKSDPEWLAPLVALVDSLKPSGWPRRRCSWLQSSVAPELVSAYQLYQSDSLSRWEVEARILAGQSDAEVASSTGLAPAVVAAYERTFFQVRDRLAAGDYILNGVIGYDPFGGFREGDLRTLWGYFGYAAGPKLLELVMAVSLGRSLPDWALCEAPSRAAAEVLEIGTKVMLMASTGAMTPSKLRKMTILRTQMAELKLEAPPKVAQTRLNATESHDCEGRGDVADRAAGSTVSTKTAACEGEGSSSPRLAEVA